MSSSDVALSELVEIRHGFAFKGEFFSDKRTQDMLLTPGNFRPGGGFSPSNQKWYSGPVPEEYVLSPGDLIVTMTDLSRDAGTLGYPAIVPSASAGWRYLHNQRLGKVRVLRPDLLDKRYLYYLMCSAAYRHEILAGATGTTVRHTSPTRILKFRFDLPALQAQRDAAALLGAFDDKIELNRKMSRALDETARSLFEARFVRFDGASVDEQTDLPVGWRYSPFSETVTILSGGTPKTSVDEHWGGAIPWFAIADAPSDGEVFVLDTAKKVTPLGIANSAAQVLPAGTTILTARGTVGLRAMAGVDMAINQSCFGLRGVHEGTDYYTYAATGLVVDRLRQYSHGSVFSTINRATFSSVSVVDPPLGVIRDYEMLVAPLMDRIRLNGVQSSTLAALRDALLPRLLSGQLRVADAEKVAEEVV